jgi:hypothetical protein
MFEKTKVFLLVLVLLLPLFSVNALTSTSLTLEKYVGDTYEIGKQVQFSARLLDANNNYISNKPVSLYYKIGSTGSWTYVDTKYTDAIGYASFTFTAGSVGAYIFRANFTGDSTYEESVSNEVTITFVQPSTTTTTTPASGVIKNWGTVKPYGFNATLVSNSSNWSVLSPLEFSAYKNASVHYRYNLNPLSQFDFCLKWADSPNFFAQNKEVKINYTIVVGTVKVQDIKHYKQWNWGFGSSRERTIYTLMPNGTIFVYDATKFFDDPLRTVLYRDERGYLIFGWFFGDGYMDPFDVPIIHDGKATAWNLGQNFNVQIDQYLKLDFAGYNLYGVNVKIFACKISQEPCKVYVLRVLNQENPSELLWYAFMSGDKNTYYDAVYGRVIDFYKNIPTWIINTLNALGLKWLVEAIVWISEAVRLTFNVIVMTLPYIGLIFLIINLGYIARLDFAGLFQFYLNLYQVIANMVSAIVGVVSWIIDAVKTAVSAIGTVVGGAAG